MICPRCGNQTLDNKSFCMMCGCAFVQAPQPQPQYNYQQMQYTPPPSPGAKNICPTCGKELPVTVNKCYMCGTQITNAYDPKQSQLIPCPVCHNAVSPTAHSCPYCGTPNIRKVANPIGLDAIAVLALAISIFAYVAEYWVFAYGVMLVLMIVYWLYYGSIKDNPTIDSSKVKHSLTIITILFVVMFCLGFTLTFTFE